MSHRSLKNKVVIVTGGSGGIGSAIVDLLSNFEATVVSVYCNSYPIDNLDGNTCRIQADLTQSEEWDKIFLFTLNSFGKIDVLINCTGLLIPGNFSSLEEVQIERMIKINLTSVLVGSLKALKIFREQNFGHIINIGSLGGIVPMPYSSVYSAAKFALRGFTFSLFKELKKTNLKLSLLSPGTVVTKMLDNEAQCNDTAISFVTNPVGPIEVAKAVLQLIHRPEIERIIPYRQSFGSKLLIFSPKLFSLLYNLLHRIGILKKIKYLNRYCDFTLMKGVVR